MASQTDYTGRTLPVAPAAQAAWRCGFDKVITGNVDPNFVQLLQTGTGMAVNQTAGSLVMTSGTTANSETIIRSLTPFDNSIVLRWSASLSQRIAQNNFYIEMVDVIGDGLAYTINSATSVTVTFPATSDATRNPFTSQNATQSMWLGKITGAAGIPMRAAIASVSGQTVTFTVSGWPATGTGTLSLFGWNYHQIIYSGTTATNIDFDSQRNGWASGATTATINTTASTHVGTFTGSDGEAAIMDQTGASATGVETTRRGSRVRNVPVAEAQLYLQIRILNGTTNPVSTTTWTVGVVDISSVTALPVVLQNVAPMSANSALPVEQVSSIPVVVSSITTAPALVASSAVIGDVGLVYRSNASAGASRSHLVSGASTNATSVKAGVGRLVGWSIHNTNAAIRCVKLHNTAGAPTAGSGVVQTISVPANGVRELTVEGGIPFSTGIAFTTVTETADAGTTAVGSGDLIIDLFFA